MSATLEPLPSVAAGNARSARPVARIAKDAHFQMYSGDHMQALGMGRPAVQAHKAFERKRARERRPH